MAKQEGDEVLLWDLRSGGSHLTKQTGALAGLSGRGSLFGGCGGGHGALLRGRCRSSGRCSWASGRRGARAWAAAGSRHV